MRAKRIWAAVAALGVVGTVQAQAVTNAQLSEACKARATQLGYTGNAADMLLMSCQNAINQCNNILGSANADLFVRNASDQKKPDSGCKELENSLQALFTQCRNGLLETIRNLR